MPMMLCLFVEFDFMLGFIILLCLAALLCTKIWTYIQCYYYVHKYVTPRYFITCRLLYFSLKCSTLVQHICMTGLVYQENTEFSSSAYIAMYKVLLITTFYNTRLNVHICMELSR